MAAPIHAYCEDQAAMLCRRGLHAAALIRCGDPADEILAATNATVGPVIVMTAQSREGDGRAHLGHVARRVVKHATVPVILVRTDEDAIIDPLPAIWAIMVMLDGSDHAEANLTMAAQMARALKVPLTLLYVVPNAFFLATVTQAHEETYEMLAEMEAFHRMREERAAAYLHAVATRIETRDLVVDVAVMRSATNRASEGLATYMAKRPHTLPIIARGARDDGFWPVRGEMLARALERMPHALMILPAGVAWRSSSGEETEPRLLPLRLRPPADTSPAGERAHLLPGW
jgi:nucleotide-binding universal stress UspA family protein